VPCVPLPEIPEIHIPTKQNRGGDENTMHVDVPVHVLSNGGHRIVTSCGLNELFAGKNCSMIRAGHASS